MSLQCNRLATRAFALAAKLSGGLASLPNRLVPPPFRLMQIGSAFWQSRALYVAARLDLATHLGDDGLSVAELARRAQAEPAALARLMRLLAAMGVFAEESQGTYRNNRLSQPLRGDRPGSVRAVVMMHNSPEMTRPWTEELEAGVKDGSVPFERTHGRDFFGYLDAHPEFDALFAEAMGAVEALTGDSFATEINWRRFARVFDVGGSRGAKAISILKRHPHLHAVVIDRANVIKDAAATWGAEWSDCLGRLRFEEGDVFAALPAAADSRDAYLLSAVLHGFSDDDCVRALANVARAAAPAGAAIIVLELVLPATGADIMGAAMDMQMFMATRGRERTQAEWATLAAAAGLRLDEVVDLLSFAKALVLRPVAA